MFDSLLDDKSFKSQKNTRKKNRMENEILDIKISQPRQGHREENLGVKKVGVFLVKLD